jgi:HEAT repeat protein
MGYWEELINQLKSKDPQKRVDAAKRCHHDTDPVVVPALIKALSDKDHYVVNQVIIALNQIMDERSIDPLIKFLSTETRSYKYLDKEESQFHHNCNRAEAATVLGNFKAKEAIDPLLTVLENDYLVLRQNAAFALGQIGDKRVVPQLIKRLYDEQWSVRDHTISALEQLGDLRAIEPLKEMLKIERYDHIKKAARKAIRTIKQKNN